MSKGGGKLATYPGISACTYESRFRGCSLKTVRSGLQTRQGRSIDPRGGAGSSVTDDNVTVCTPDMGATKCPISLSTNLNGVRNVTIVSLTTFHRIFKIAKRLHGRIKYFSTLYRCQKLFCFYTND